RLQISHFAVARAEAVAHAVVAGEVGRGLGGGDQVIRGNGVFSMRQGDVDDLAAGGAQLFDSRFHGGPNFFVEAFAEVLLGNTNLQAAHRLLDFLLVVGDRNIGGGGVERVASGNVAQNNSGILHRPGQRPDMVERRGKGNQAVTRDASV